MWMFFFIRIEYIRSTLFEDLEDFVKKKMKTVFVIK